MFLDVPARVYANAPHWVPPIRSSVAKHFAPSNPFFEYGKLQQFIALSQEEKGDQAVGRIVAAINERLITPESQNVGLIGFLSAFQILMSLSHCWRLPASGCRNRA